jgi:hypothetical protein
MNNKVKEVKGEEQYRVETSHWFALFGVEVSLSSEQTNMV